MNAETCAICGDLLGAAIYDSETGLSLTSLCRIHPAATQVRSCTHCGHLQTRAISNVDDFYDTEYDILVDSDEEDQIYEMRRGEPVYRTAHQVSVLRANLEFDRPTSLLDYGCAKSSTLRTLRETTDNVDVHLFDVSERYVPFWEKFVAPAQWAISEVPAGWKGKFDVVTSFFSLEHIPDVMHSVREIAGLLKPGGVLYVVVPNVVTNIADLVVLDHCNHFTDPSIRYLMASAGLDVESVDDTSHRGAFVIVARRNEIALPNVARLPVASSVRNTLTELDGIAAFWRSCATRVRQFEEGIAADTVVAIYGAGFYGAFIRASLRRPERVVCHLDQNRFLQGKLFNGAPVLPPSSLPAEVGVVLVGLNPAHARAIIAGVPELERPALRFFYL